MIIIIFLFIILVLTPLIGNFLFMFVSPIVGNGIVTAWEMLIGMVVVYLITKYEN